MFIALDIGPIGQLLEPMGTLKFEEAYDIFKRQVIEGEKSGADIILIETMTDLYETKAAILAAKENSKLPVFCTMTFEKNGRTFTGCNLPKVKDGKTIYDITPKEFAYFQKAIVEKGVRIIGGCCGTTDEFIRELVEAIKDVKIAPIENKRVYGVSSYSKTVFIDNIRVIGERINPTGNSSYNRYSP